MSEHPLPSHAVQVLDAAFITHNVIRFKVQKPKGYTFIPGQATLLALDEDGGQDRHGAFTFTSLPGSRHLEFMIKIYPERRGLTYRLGQARKGAKLLIGDPFGAITYQGPGYFFAGGAGVTPFIAILRSLYKENKIEGNTLVCSNQTASDIILDAELTRMLGKNFLNFLTRQHVIGFTERRIDREIVVRLVQNFDQHFYICGPRSFVSNIKGILTELGATAESIVIEQ